MKLKLFSLMALMGVLVFAGQNLFANCGQCCKSKCQSKLTKYDKDPSSNKWNITTVRWIKGTHNHLKDDDRYVVLIGKIIKKIDGDTYLFCDNTGVIELDSEIELPQDKNIVVRGEIDQAWLNMGTSEYDNVEIEVKSWRFDKSDKK